MADKKEKEEDAGPEVGQMKKGDYMIHVFIEGARKLDVPAENPADPMVEVTVLGVKKYTSTKEKVGPMSKIHWNEHMFFEPKNVSQDDIEGAKITIRLMDKGFFKDAIIGAYEFDVAYIYFMKNHVMEHQWIALNNTASANFNKVTAYLKLSINVVAVGDAQVHLKEDTGKDDESKVLMPTSIKPEFYQIKFRFFKGEKLAKMDSAIFGGGTIDAYVTAQYMGKKLKTKVVTQGKEECVYWNQEFLLPCQLPIMASKLKMKLWDEDKLADEIVGSFSFNLKEMIQMIQENKMSYFWKNIYGSPLNVSGETKKAMNENPDIASTWKGRLLMQVTATKTEAPELGINDIPEDQLEGAKKYMEPKEYEFIAEVGQGMYLPTEEDYTVRIMIGELEFDSAKPQFRDRNYNRWNHRWEATRFTTSYQEIEDAGRVYIYLVNKAGVPVCFHHLPIRDFLDPNPKMQWFSMQADGALGKVKDPQKAGIISFKMSIHDPQKDLIDYKNFDAWKKKPQKRLDTKKIRAYVFQCRDLPAADSDGQSDPYLDLYTLDKKKAVTEVVWDNLNPMFYKVLEMTYEVNPKEEMPPIIIDCYDRDEGVLDGGDDFIARALIFEKDANVNYEDKVPTPKWHPFRLKPDSPKCGEVLISFSIVETDFNFTYPADYQDLTKEVDFDDFNVEITVLGLRSLQSVGILPVKKAYIQFMLKSLVPPENARTIENIETQPGPAGANPTINTTIKFTIPLPGDELYCPRLQCSVFDNIFRGFSQPIIGVFTIPVGDIMQAKAKERKDYLDMLDYIIEQVKLVMKQEAPPTYSSQAPPIVRPQTNQSRPPSAVNASDGDSSGSSSSSSSGSSSVTSSRKSSVKGSVKSKQVADTARVSARGSNMDAGSVQYQKTMATPKESQTIGGPKGSVQRQQTEKSKTSKIQTGSKKSESSSSSSGTDSEEEKKSISSKKEKEELENAFKQQQAAWKGDKESLLEREGELKDLKAPLLGIDELEKTSNKSGVKVVTSRSKKSMRSHQTPHSYGGVARTPRKTPKDLGLTKTGKTDNAMDVGDGRADLDPAVKKALLDEAKKAKKDFQDKLEAQRQRDAEAFKNSNKKAANNIIFPEYELDERLDVYVEKEDKIPPESLFMGVGYDSDPELIVQQQEREKIAKGKPTSGKVTPATKRSLMKSSVSGLTPGVTPGATPVPGKTPQGAVVVPDEGDAPKKAEVQLGGRHYRRFYADELEHVKEIMPLESPFDQFMIKKGQSRGGGGGLLSLFSKKKTDDSGEVTTEQIMGKFKGLITVDSKQRMEEFEIAKQEKLAEVKRVLAQLSWKVKNKELKIDSQKLQTQEGRVKFHYMMEKLGVGHLNIQEYLSKQDHNENLRRMLLKETKCIVRCYVLNAANLVSRDSGSDSDPYLIMRLGKKKYNERENYQEDEPDPQFFKYFDFEAVFPGCPPLEIMIYDYDEIFGDDLIGTAEVDLEDRFFQPSWQQVKDKPIEERDIWHPSSGVSQGLVRLWVNIVPTILLNNIKIWDTAPKPPDQLEVRICIFGTEGIKMMDPEGTSDVFIRVFFNSKNYKETDTHFRNQDGKASFNYRLVYDIEFPNKKDGTLLTIQAFDKDFFKSNDLIGETQIDLQPILDDISLTNRPMQLGKEYYDDHFHKLVEEPKLTFKDADSFWVDVIGMDEDTGEPKVHGKIRMRIDIYPKAQADNNKVGSARQEPNHSPFLPPPIGRLSFSLNPFKMLNQLVGPAFRRKIYCACCVIICCALCVALFPLIISSLITKMIEKIMPF